MRTIRRPIPVDYPSPASRRAAIRTNNVFIAIALGGVAVGAVTQSYPEIPSIIRWHMTDLGDAVFLTATMSSGFIEMDGKARLRTSASIMIAGGAVWEGLQSVTAGRNSTLQTIVKIPDTIANLPRNRGTHPYDFADAATYVVGACAYAAIRKAMMVRAKKWVKPPRYRI